MNRFPLGKIGALAAMLGMTLFTFVSCEGPMGSGMGIKGHELLRNKASFDDTLSKFGNLDKSLKGIGDASDGGETTSPKPEVTKQPKVRNLTDGPLFKDNNRWLHWMYLGLFALATLSIFMPTGSRILIVLGMLGAGGVVFWIDRFNTMVMSDAPSEAAMMISFSWDTGSIAAALGFAAIAICGFWGKPDRSA